MDPERETPPDNKDDENARIAAMPQRGM